jgi:hypothetical protein
MRNILLAAATCFLFTLGLCGQPAYRAPKGIESAYDKFRDQTRVSFETSPEIPRYSIYTHGWGLRMVVAFTFSGKEINRNADEFNISFMGSCPDRGYCFEDKTELIFLTDGLPLTLTHPNSSPDYVSDVITYELSRAELKRLADSKTVEFTLDRNAAKLTSKQIALIATLLSEATFK